MDKPINEKITELRKARSLTQEKLGERLGVSSQAVSKWEKGECLPDIMLLPHLCEILGISIDSLLEAPHVEEKERVYKQLGVIAKEDGCIKTSFEAMRACTNAIDNRSVHGSVHHSPDGMRIFSEFGIGAVINGKEALDTLINLDVKLVCDTMKLIANPCAVKIMSAFKHGESLSESQLTELCDEPEEEVNKNLLSLIKLKFCDYEPDGNVSLGTRSYAWYLSLCGVFMASAQGHREINSISKSY